MSSTSVPDAYVDALLEAADAPGGVDCDGLVVEAGAEGFRFETPDDRERGLSAVDLRAAADSHPELVSNWHFWARVAPSTPPRRAFLRWLESAERPVEERYPALRSGEKREWGQLLVVARLADDPGRRRYDLLHVEDGDAVTGSEIDTEGMTVYEDPGEIRELVKYDPDGRYRPLKTAPTMRSGWAFPGLEADALLAAVDFAYPATIENWHREREGELDVSHWRDTIDRQTGIYQLVQTWDRGEGHDHVDRVAEACCVDSQCLKRREWQYDEETELDVPGGEGEFPCREPCSLVISAARKWTKLEGDQPRTYEVELTESELEQLAAIVDAVADGRVPEIREADFDDPANRYRARYLRAKRFADGAFATERAATDESATRGESDDE